MKFAFHKAKDTLFAKLCSWKMEGPYTHVEALFGPDPDNSKLTVCGSSKFTEGGVRLTSLDFSDKTVWDIVEVPGIDEAKALQWFKDHAGEPYDTRGLIQFITFFPVGHNPKGWFCDEAVLASIGMEDSYRFDPNAMASILTFLTKYQAGNLSPVLVTIKEGEVAAVAKPVNPIDTIQADFNKVLPAVEQVAHTVQLAAPLAAVIPGLAPVVAVVEGVATAIDKVAEAAPQINTTIDALQALKKI
jgi:hypothetical protein